ncbi:MAG: acetate/propionate family kinase [Acetanaerobacterium sp.]
MKVLVINAGSSSLKYQLINMENEQVIAKGNCEKIGIGGFITHKTADGRIIEQKEEFPTHAEAFMKLTEVLTSGDGKVIESMKEIVAVGHRIVQGAERFTESVLVTDSVVDTIEEIAELAPLHNYAHVLAIRACQKVLGKEIPEVVVFDTAFHQTMPEKAYMFGIPYEYYEKYHIRRYGFHGTSHRYVSRRLAKLLGKNPKELKIITCHIGNGSSITAVDGGRSVDTSMGFTPLGGILMGTRSGSLDPSVVTYIAEKENLSGKQLSELLNKQSGYLGISGVTSDDRDMRAAAASGNKRAQLALTMVRYQIKKYIGSYAAAMGGLDAVAFTGGIGENSIELRREVCDNMEFLGIKIDEHSNVEYSGKEHDISADGARVRTWIVPTNEELTIARDTVEIINKIR